MDSEWRIVNNTLHYLLSQTEKMIKITPRRGKYQSCFNSSTTSEKMDWYDEKSKHTKAFE